MNKWIYNDIDIEVYMLDFDVRFIFVCGEDDEEYDSRGNEVGDDGCIGVWCYEEFFFFF